MKSSLAAIILAVAVGGGVFYYYAQAPATGEPAPLGDTSAATSEVTPSTATNYDECIAEGGTTLPDASDKCLTRDGHVFIKDVVE